MTNKIITNLILALTASAVVQALPSAAAAAGAPVTVQVHEVASGKGEVLIALCDEATFMKACTRRQMVAAKRGSVSATFADVPAGRWAVMSYHDENSDKQLNRSKLGVPTEGSAFSGKPQLSGPPTFAGAAFPVDGRPKTVDIDLIYY